MGAIIGIDLGTTNSVVSYMKLGKPIIAENKGEKIIPSVVHIKENGEVLVGNLAKKYLGAKYERTVGEIKRKMGTDETILIDGIEYSPQKISALILEELKEFSQVYLGEEIKEAVITVPANFNNRQREATKEAATLAGLNVKRLINEPTSAALAYGYENLDKEGNMLVYDLGGGTFDVSILELNDGVFDVKSSEGNMKLGGKDFDERLMDYVLENIKGEMNIDLSNDAKSKALIKQEAERVKIELSYSDESEFFIPALQGVFDEFGMPLCIELTIHRNKLESLINDLVDKTEEIIEKSIEEANLDYEDIDIVLPAGGSTKIPMVRNLLKRKFGDRVRFDLNPDEVVAQGAAVLASIDKNIEIENIANESEKENTVIHPEIIVTDICPFTLGIEIVAKEDGALIPGKFDRLISKNTTIPTFKKECYCTVKDNQEKVLIKVFQGEDDFVENNIHIGTLEVSDIPRGMAGEQEIEVMFVYEENGTLNIETTLLSTGASVKSVFLKPDEVDLPKDIKELLEEANLALSKTWPEKRVKLQEYIDKLKAAFREKDNEALKEYEKLITDIVFEIEFIDMNEAVTK